MRVCDRHGTALGLNACMPSQAWHASHTVRPPWAGSSSAAAPAEPVMPCTSCPRRPPLLPPQLPLGLTPTIYTQIDPNPTGWAQAMPALLGDKEHPAVQDNAAGAVARMIQGLHSHIPLDQVCTASSLSCSCQPPFMSHQKLQSLHPIPCTGPAEAHELVSSQTCHLWPGTSGQACADPQAADRWI